MFMASLQHLSVVSHQCHVPYVLCSICVQVAELQKAQAGQVGASKLDELS